MNTPLQNTLHSSPILRLPPEIRCQIYCLLLVSERPIRMNPPPQDEYHIPRPNNLSPAILGTCHLIYHESQGVLYEENLFYAHRIDSANRNAVLIRRAKYCIDMEDKARELAYFLGFHQNLKHIVLGLRFDLIEDPDIQNLIELAVLDHGSLMGIEIGSQMESQTSLKFACRLFHLERGQALVREYRREK